MTPSDTLGTRDIHHYIVNRQGPRAPGAAHSSVNLAIGGNPGHLEMRLADPNQIAGLWRQGTAYRRLQRLQRRGGLGGELQPHERGGASFAHEGARSGNDPDAFDVLDFVVQYLAQEQRRSSVGDQLFGRVLHVTDSRGAAQGSASRARDEVSLADLEADLTWLDRAGKANFEGVAGTHDLPKAKVTKTQERDRAQLVALHRLQDQAQEPETGQDWISWEMAREEGALALDLEGKDGRGCQRSPAQ